MADSAPTGTRPGTRDLVVRCGSRSWDLAPGDRLTVGRAEDAQVRVADPRVSRAHAHIHHTGEACGVTDLASSRGTYLVGQRVTGTDVVAPPLDIRLGPDGPEVTVEWAAPQEQARSATGEGPVDDTAPAGDAVVVGRDPSCDIVVEDLLVSRRHARVVWEGTGHVVEDLGSRHGTFVDGERVLRSRLRPDSLLTVGRHSFRLVDGMLRREDDDGDISFAAAGLGFTLPNGRALLQDISFALPGASLMAIIGGSGAGKTTLLDALTGVQPATSGQVLYDGRDLYQHIGSLRQRIGVVPQDDVVHHHLTARQALEFAAELRFPDDLDAASRAARITDVLDELGLTEHQHTRVGALSGGQRKRVSVALELLTQPSLIFLDEPTSGLDMDLVAEVMETLRRLADGGRTVVVVTHTPEGLDLCDRILVLAPGGRVAYFGEPERVLEHFGTDSFREMVKRTKQDPEGVAAQFRASAAHRRHVDTPLGRLTGPVRPEPPAEARQQSLRNQVSTLVRRHLSVLWADRTRVAFLALLPLVLAGLALVVPGEQGLAPAVAGAEPTGQPTQMRVVLTLGAVFMGLAASIGDLVGERTIYLRERWVGLSPTAYLVAKLGVFGALVLVQCTVLVGLTLALRKGPKGAALVGSPALELVVALWLCALACVALGLLVSALVTTSEQMMPVLVILVMVQLVLSAGLFPMHGRAVLEQVSWLAPSRWGYAATASTADIATVIPGASDPLWERGALVWLGCLLALVVLAAAYAVLARLRLAGSYRSRRR